ncbi:hypothetical protein D3C85_1688040 [compost metagenome]
MAYCVCCGRFFGCTSSSTETFSGIWSISPFRLSIWKSWRMPSITIQGAVGWRVAMSKPPLSFSPEITPTTGRSGLARLCTRRLISYSRNSS